MFEGWDNFYLIIGGAAGALIGLMFVVATLGTGRNREESLRGASLYMTPTVVGFSVVLVVAAFTAVPHVNTQAAAAVLGAIAGAGALYAAINLRRMLGGKPPHWSDYWCYGWGPLAYYLALGAAAASTAAGAGWAAQAVAAVMMAILLLAIRNAWDLVTWLAPANRGDSA